MYVFIVFAPSSSRLSRVVPPCATSYKRGTGSRLVTRSGVFEIPVAERLEHSSSVSFNNTFIQEYITSPLYIRRMSSEYLRALQTSWRGWADSKAVHSMECRGGAHALLESYLSVGAAACDALYCQRWEVYYLKLVLTLKEPNNRLTP